MRQSVLHLKRLPDKNARKMIANDTHSEEDTHSGRVLHVAAHQQIEGQYQPDIVDYTNKLALVVALTVVSIRLARSGRCSFSSSLHRAAH
jgi:hypothetical protein